MIVLENTSQRSYGTSNFDWGWTKGTTPSPAVEIVRYREGVRRKKPSSLDPTPFKARFDRMDYPRGTWSYSDRWTPHYGVEGYNDFNTTGFNPWAFSNIDSLPDLRDLAYTHALAKMDRKDLDLGQAVKDAGKTAEMITELAKVSVESIRAIRARNVPRLLDALGLRTPRMRGKGIVDAHLTYTWGIRPLLSDIAGAADSLLRKPLDAFTIRARSRKSETYHDVKEFISYGSCRMDITRTAKAQAVIVARIKPLTDIQDTFWSTGLDNGLSTLWEFAPFSDVLDYIVPIGDFLQGLNSLKYYEGWQICTTMFNEEHIDYTGLTAKFSLGKSTSSCKGHLHRVRIERSVASAPYLPSQLPVKIPSVNQMATALSLFAGIASGHTPRYLRVT